MNVFSKTPLAFIVSPPTNCFKSALSNTIPFGGSLIDRNLAPLKLAISALGALLSLCVLARVSGCAVAEYPLSLPSIYANVSTKVVLPFLVVEPYKTKDVSSLVDAVME